MLRLNLAACLLALLPLAACAPQPLRTPLPAQWQPSPSFDERRPNLIVLHYTGETSLENGIKGLTEPQTRVSAHYVVGRDGSLHQLVDERMRAWHAGESRWGNDTDLNSTSIGI